MLHLTAVTSKEKEDKDRNNSQETGIFVKHSPTKICSKNNNFFSNWTRILLIICYVSLYFTSTVAVTNFNALKPPPAPVECGSFELRNDCENFYKIENCTVITGFLGINFIHNEVCDFSQYRFDNLREVTDFLLFTEVLELSSIKNLFPNLTVIRGRRLFINYALLMTSLPTLEKVEFKSLIAIQRGHVLMDDNIKLCHTEKINWTRLTLRPGTNNVFSHKNAQCPKETKCTGCERDSCWSNDVCQKFENDSVISLMQDTMDCDSQCLGGCYNETAQGCVVCKTYTDHGTCLETCPKDKFASSHFLRCYTREECLNKKLYIHKKECVDRCPVGYKLNNSTGVCDYCGDRHDCLRVCTTRSDGDQVIYVTDIMHAEFLKSCELLNATVFVNIREFIDQQVLEDNLMDVKEITGYLKIARSPYLTSLNLFKNLEKIHGRVLESKLYALIIYDNKNLSQLWDVKPGLEIVNGGIYIHGNDRVCNRRISQFRENIKHDNNMDTFQKSDQEVLCAPAKLNLYMQVLNHRSIKFHWPKDQTLDVVEIIYRPLVDKQILSETSEIYTEVCNRIQWHRELFFDYELYDNATHYFHIVDNLLPHTRYACLVKTFNDEYTTQEARSEIKYATTKRDIPNAPKIDLKSKTYDTLHIEFSADRSKTSVVGSPVVDYYVLEVYHILDDKKLLDTRDYCETPDLSFREFNEDYDECCSRREREQEDNNFLSQFKKEFACSLDQTEYCKRNQETDDDDSEMKAILIKRFEPWENNYIIRSLRNFHLYVLKIRGCNQAGCSSYSMLSARTNFSLAADKLYDLSACKQDDTKEYRVYFSEPRLPNGYITSYVLYFRNNNFNEDKQMIPHTDVLCITRLEHERNNYVYARHYNDTFNQATVRVHSLGHSIFMEWQNITTCKITTIGVRSSVWTIIFSFILFGIAGILLWIAKKHGYLSQLYDWLPSVRGRRGIRPHRVEDPDRDLLTDSYHVLFHNVPEMYR